MTDKHEPAETEPGRTSDGIARRVVGVARDAASGVVEAASGVVEAASSVVDDASELGDTAADRIRAATRRIRGGEGRSARQRRLRRLNRVPLPNLFDLHAEARVASRRELGLLTIPVSKIRGTAVEGAAQRGSDFLPLPALKSLNWQNRWQRIRDAMDRLEILPPIDVLQTSDDYWVTDGHNRVAAALYGGQDDIDASVTHVHLPNSDDAGIRTGALTNVLEDSRQLRAAGAGRLSRGATARPSGSAGGYPRPAAQGGAPPRRRKQSPPEPGDAEPGQG